MFYYFVYRLGEIIALYLPSGFVRWLSIRIADIFYIIARKNREALKANLQVILKQKDKNRINYYSRWIFRNFARSVVEFFRFSKVDAQFLKRFVKIEGIKYFDQALALGKGVIAITAHIGNWELSGAVVSLLGYRLNVVALPHKNRLVDSFFTDKRRAKGIKVIPMGSSIKESFSVLAKNQMLVLAGDRDFSGNGIKVDFFNKPAFMPKGIAVLSLRFGSPIVPAFLIRNNDNTFKLTVEEPIIYKPTGKRKQDLKNLTQKYVRVMETYIGRFPEQWSVFGKVWEEEKKQ